MSDPGMRRRPALCAGLCAATLLLAACHKSEPPPPPAENEAIVEPEPAPEPAAPVEPAPQVIAAPPTETPPRPRPAPEVSADQQVLDDADATGMTARVQRGGDSGDSPSPSGGGNDQD